jgi:hypothetical protein
MFPFSGTGSTEAASPFLPSGGYGGGYGGGYYSNNNCYFFDNGTTKSVWFTLTGDGACYTASTYGSSSEISATIFTGKLCDSFVCLGQSEPYDPNGVTWQSEVGESYYILVGGRYGNAGSFFLDVEVRDCAPSCLKYMLCHLSPTKPLSSYFSIMLQRGECLENDRCESALQVEILPFVDAASNSLATQNGYDRPGLNCFVAQRMSKVVWYELEGDGSCLSASVVGESFETALVLFEGENCDRISCADENYFGSARVVTWQSEIGSTYKLLVGGLYTDESGDFILAITVRLGVDTSATLLALLAYQHD